MGDAVNLAARLEDASSEGEIFVGPTTYRLTQRIFDFEPVPPLRLKGKEAPVEVHRLIGAKVVPKSTRGIEGLRAPLVGRDKELGRAVRDLSFPGSVAGAANGRTDGKTGETPFERSTSIWDFGSLARIRPPSRPAGAFALGLGRSALVRPLLLGALANAGSAFQ